MSIPKIIICGLKGSGKSTIYRHLINRYSLFKNSSKVIPPLINYTKNLIKYKENFYYLFDTPAFIIYPQNGIDIAQQNQLKELLGTSSLIVWVIDGNQEINNEMINLNKYLQSFFVSNLLILNKLDLVVENYKINFFQKLKQKNVYRFSSVAREADWERLIEEFINLIPNKTSDFSKIEEEKNKFNELKITIFGPPNSGKSTLMNYLLKMNRSVVSPVAGTTQESVKEWYNWQDWKLEITDTTGINKDSKKKIFRDLIKNDLVWIVIDATYPFTKHIAQIIHLAEENNKPSIIIINKADLITPEQKKTIEQTVRGKMKSLRFVPTIFISALKKKGLDNLLKHFKEIIEQSQKQFTKNQIAKTIENMVLKSPPTYYYQGKKLKIYFTKHKSGLIHYFILFVNNPKLVHFSYQRYIINTLRKNLDLKYLPIKLIFKKSS